MDEKKIAYLLLVHKNPNQVNKFIKQLLNIGNCDIYIHVDTKSKGIISQLIKDNRVHIYSYFDVKWGSFEIVESAIFLMKEIKKLNKKYDYVYFGSGQDLIIRKGLLNYLDQNKDKIFIHINKEPIKDRDRRTSRHKIKWPKCLMIRNDLHLYRFIRIALSLFYKIGINFFPNKCELKRKVIFFEGRTWFVIPFEVMNYIIDYLDNNEDYTEYWRDSLASDLMFFQTLIMNSPYKDKIEDELMFVEFGSKFWNMNHPYTLKMEDIKRLEDSNKFFARKFDENEDSKIIKYFLEKVRC